LSSRSATEPTLRLPYVERHALLEEMFDSRPLHIFVSTESAAPAEPGEVFISA
jgi:hypothetical protein